MSDKVELMGLHRPGVLFEAGNCEFRTQGGTGADGLYVIRLDNGSRDTLDVDLLYDDYQDGDVRLLGTHKRGTEVGISRLSLAMLADDANSLADDQPANIVEDAIVDAYGVLNCDYEVNVE